MKRPVGGKALALAVLCTALCGCAGRLARQPMPGSHPDLRGRMLAHLGENLLPFWLEHCVDSQYGGFLTELSADGSVYGTDKALVTQAGTIGTLARLWREGYHDPRIREAAAQGMEFLAQNFSGKHGRGVRGNTPQFVTEIILSRHSRRQPLVPPPFHRGSPRAVLNRNPVGFAVP